ncbi:hypothetical protein PQX77_000444, partial [Marasmius sp. AFHP31]
MEHDGAAALQTFSQALRLGSQLESVTLCGTAALDDREAHEPYKVSDEPIKEALSGISSLTVEISEAEGFVPLIYDLSNRDIAVPAESQNLPHSTASSNVLIVPSRPWHLKHTPSLHTFILYELWATGEYRDNLNRRQKWKSKLEPQYQIVTKTFLEKLGALTVVADPFAATQYLLVPRLKTLKLGVHSHFDGDDTFVDFVKSRWMQADGD